MSRHIRTPLVLFLIGLAALPGCHPTQPFYFHNDGDMSHYLDKATNVEHPDAEHPRLGEVDSAQAPLTLSNPDFTEIWQVSLEECISIALHNSKVIRNAASIQANFGFSDPLIGRTAGLPTIYDPAITESSTLGTNRSALQNGTGQFPLSRDAARATNQGVEDALAEFDAQLAMSLGYGVSNRPQNISQNVAFFQARNLQSNGTQAGSGPGGAIASLTKKTASGARIWIRSQSDYDYSNQPSRLYTGDWTQSFEMEWNQPLGRGAGTMVNRIPTVLARINMDISLADFEAAVRNLMMDLENAYWDLHYAYRNLEATKVGRDSAQATWKITYEKFRQGIAPSHEEAQSRGQFYQLRAAAETALKDLYSSESKLRWLMGLASTDGRLIQPKDEPSLALVEYDWSAIHAESLFRSTELRQQKWRIKQRELELVSAKNQLLPDVDLVWLHRWIGKGDNFINADRNGLNYETPGSTAFDVLTEGEFQEEYVGLRFTPPKFGARHELSAIRNAQLALARSKAQLEEMELNQSHLLSEAIRAVDANYTVAQSHFNRWVAAETEVKSQDALVEGGKATLDLVLDAQRRRAQAQVDYYRALTEYNKSLTFVHYRKGSLLEHNNVLLSEGPWPQKAYWDAVGHARERDSSYYLNYGFTRPRVVSRGPVEQMMGEAEMSLDGPGEAIPAPVPTPAEKAAPQDDALPSLDAGPITSSKPQRIPEKPLREAAKSPVRQASAERDATDSDGSAKPSPRPSSNPLRRTSANSQK